MKFKQNLNLIIKYKSVQTFKRKEILHKFIIKIIKTTLDCSKLMSYISCKCYLIIQEEGKSSCGPDSKWNLSRSISLLDSYLLYHNEEKEKEKVEFTEYYCYTENLNIIKWSVLKILEQTCL